jgi:asparagine synthase (glutamine-hydrolysing)
VSGICGWVDWDRRPVVATDFEPMIGAAGYRGPDGITTWSQEGAALAHLALHSTPESVREVQPLEDAEAGLVLVADARIDNRDDLIPVLRQAGRISDRVPSDAEVILGTYRLWGDICPARLVGDFAFAVWDRRQHRLFLARDPMGMRSLHVRAGHGRFLFGTEAKQVVAAPGVSDELYRPAVAAFLAGGFGSPEWTFHVGVQRLPPGHALVARPDGSRSWRYWVPDAGTRIRYRNEDEYTDHFLDLMKGAMKARLRSVRPAGILLSGGVDSGLIAATAGWLRARGADPAIPEVRAYSFAWDRLRECDERHISGPLAEHCGIPVSEIPADDAWPLRSGWESALDPDTPFLFGHYVSLNRAARRAQEEGVGLILSGDRGDLVAGMWILDLPALFVSGRWPTLVRELRTLARWNNRSFLRQARRELRRVLPESARFHRTSWGALPPFRRFHATPARKRGPQWLPEDVARGALEAREEAWLEPVPPFPSHAARQRHRAIFTPLHMLGVAASERMHAVRGQTFADPWSDRRIAEFACQIPQRVLNRVAEPKRLTRRVLERLVPEHHVRAMRKIVPTPLFDLGIRDRERPRIEALLGDPVAAECGFVDRDRLNAAYQEICRNPYADPTLLWRALTLEIWLRGRTSVGLTIP